MSGHQNGHKEGIDMNFIYQYLDYPEILYGSHIMIE